MPITDKDAQRAVTVRARQAAIAAGIDGLRKESDHLHREILTIEGLCEHSWTKPKRHAKHHKGYVIPAVRMGSDSQSETRVPPVTDVWHTRTCTVCGKTERSAGMRPGTPVPAFPGDRR